MLFLFLLFKLTFMYFHLRIDFLLICFFKGIKWKSKRIKPHIQFPQVLNSQTELVLTCFSVLDLFLSWRSTYKGLLNRMLMFTLTLCMTCEVNTSVSSVHFPGKPKNEDDIRNIWSDILCIPNVCPHDQTYYKINLWMKIVYLWILWAGL